MPPLVRVCGAFALVGVTVVFPAVPPDVVVLIRGLFVSPRPRAVCTGAVAAVDSAPCCLAVDADLPDTGMDRVGERSGSGSRRAGPCRYRGL